MSNSAVATDAMKQPLSAYKLAYHRHRRKPSDPLYIGDIDYLVDFSTKFDSDPRIIKMSKPNCNLMKDKGFEYEGPLFGIKSHPGFIYVPQALSPSIQKHLAFKAVTEFCEPPHVTNIDLVPRKLRLEIDNDSEEPNGREKLTMWNLWKKESGGLSEKKRNVLSLSSRRKRDEKARNNRKISKPQYYRTFDKLSWASLGYHYDWTSREYREGEISQVPLLLSVLGSVFASLDETSNKNIFTSSAAIVNYYTTKSSMGGHHDDSELDLTKPVISISLGLPAVFLLGGKSQYDERVVPILLRPGDIMLLAGESRTCIHGMARVLPQNVLLPPVESYIATQEVEKFQMQSFQCIASERMEDDTLEAKFDIHSLDYIPLNKFLSERRININMRQVLPDGVDRIPTK